MYILHCLVRTVAALPKDEINKETGKITPVWTMSVEHEGRNGLELVKLKAKTPVQAEAWRKCIGKEVTVPVNFVAVGKDCRPWIPEGQMPTLARSISVASPAAA